jgi:TonB family protein
MTMATLLGLYLKLNFVLAATYVLWLATKRIALLFRFDVSHARQLWLARMFFIDVVALIPLVLLCDAWFGWFSDGPAPFFDADLTVMANLDSTLAQRYEVSDVTLVPAVILGLLLLGGLAIQLTRLARQIHKLRTIVGGAVEYKCIRGIHLLFSPVVSTPFSTQALGQKQIVLPYQLLESPRNLRLAVKHELQHIRSRDLEWVLVYEVAGVFFFWNPAMWLWHNEFDCLQEFACDEALVSDRHVSSTAYGNCLLEVARTSTGGALIASSNMVPKFSFWRNHTSQLKRRILMLTTASRKQHDQVKSIAYAVLGGFGLLQTALMAFAAEPAADFTDRPLVRINPDYPQQALREEIEGWVNIEFTISESGVVVDPLIIENCAWPNNADPETCKPDDMFNGAALAAVAKWRYSPQIQDGQPVAREGVHTIIRFALQDSDEGCIYASKFYPVGTTLPGMRAVQEDGKVTYVEDPGGIEQTCIADPERPGDYRWGDYTQDGRPLNLK